MGREGVAYTFVAPDEGYELTRIEERINRLLKRDEMKDFDPRARENMGAAMPGRPVGDHAEGDHADGDHAEGGEPAAAAPAPPPPPTSMMRRPPKRYKRAL